MAVGSHVFTGKRVPRWLAGTTAAAIVLLGLPALSITPANAAIPSTGGLPDGFEIDGDFALNNGGTADWATVSSKPGFNQFSDPVGNADPSVFSASSKESSDPSTWTTAPGTAPGKTDIGGIWTYKTTSVDASGPHLWTYLAWDRDSGVGTNYFYLEFNQKPNATSTSPAPIRTVGDVRLVIHSQGSGLLNLDEADQWNGSSWTPKAAPAGSFFGAVNTAAIPLPAGFSSPNSIAGVLPDNTFYEVGFDLGAIGLLARCPSPGFGTANFRAATGQAPDNLKDYVNPVAIDIPSTCALVSVSKAVTGDTFFDDGTTTNFPLVVSGTGVKPSSPQSLPTKAGATSGPVTVDPGEKGTVITVSEGTPPDNWALTAITCKVNDVVVKDANDALPGFQVAVNAFDQVACVVTNTITAPPAAVKVTKTWNIDGAIYADGQQPAEFSGVPTITGGDPSPALPGTLAFGTTYGGFKAGRVVTIGEDLTIPADCQNTKSGALGAHTLDPGTNTYALTNAVVCNAAIQVNKVWTIDGVPYTNDNLPATFTAASLKLDGVAKSFSTPYTGYHTGDQVAVTESVTLPAGCSYVAGYPTGQGTKTLARGLNVYDVVNNVVCPATVTVNKIWVVDGVTSAPNAAPAGFSVVPSVNGSAVTLGAATGGFHRGDLVTVSESATKPADCTFIGTTGDIGNHTLVTGANVYTITNAYKCAATVQVTKTWNVDGTVYANGQQPAGLTASLTLTGQNSPTFGGGPYTGYFTGDKVTVGESTSIAGCTVSQAPTGLGEKTLVRGLNTYAVTNYVSCKATLAVEKFDADTQAPVSGGTFVLHRDNAQGAVVGSCSITAPATSCSVPNIGLGTYVWVETVPPTGYNLPANPVSDPVVVTTENSGTTITRSFSDPQKRSTIEVIKLDATSKAPLQGAGFTLRLDNGDGVYNPADDDVVAIEQLTDANGVASFGNLPFGTYWVVETTPPFGYLLSDPSVVKVVVDSTNAGTTQTLTFENPRKTSRISVTKKDADTGDLLKGFTFALRTSLDGADLATCTTGDSGSCTFSDIGFGTYYVVETAQAPGYQADAAPQGPITVDADNAGELVAELTFENSQIRSTLVVKKVDLADATHVLAGAVFELHADSAEGTLVGTCTSGDDGTCSVAGLLFGTYVWVETQAPAGWLLPSNPVSDPITIDGSNAGTTLAVTTFADPGIAIPGIGKVAMQGDAVISDDDPENPLVGTVDALSTIHYVVTVTNTGTASATGPVTDVLPAGLDTPTGISAPGVYDAATRTITWDPITVPAGGSVALSYDAVVLLKAADPEFNTLVNHASWLTVDTSTTTLVRPQEPVPAATPTLKKTADPASGTAVERGQTITYTIKVGNTGTGPAIDDVVDTLPVGVTPVAGSYTKDGVAFAPTSVTTTTITWADVTVQPGQTITFTYQVTVDDDAQGPNLVNTATWKSLTSSTTHPVTIPQLPRTGSPFDPVTGALWAGMLLALGVMLLVFGRRHDELED